MKISEKNNLSAEQSVACNSSGMGIVVSASAGAGKTKVLVSRLMKRCIEDTPRVPLSRILALTFTEAAASEMKKRVALELNDIKETVLQSSPVDEELLQYIEEQMIALSAANITTIDSYCLSIIKKYYSIIGLDPATTENILSGGQNENIQKEAFMHALDEAYRDAPEETIALASYFSGRSEDYEGMYKTVAKINRFAESAVEPQQWYQNALAAYPPKFDPNQPSQFTSFDQFPFSIRKYFFASLYGQLALIQRDIEILQNLPEAVNARGKVIDNTDAFQKFLQIIHDARKQLQPTAESLQDSYTFAVYRMYQQQIEIMTAIKLSGYKKENYPLHASTVDHLKKTLKNIAEERLNEDDFISDARDASVINTALIHLAENTYHTCAKIKRDRTAMYFSDMERFAYEILKHENIARVIRDNLLEVMIDEFQDTSTLQDTIIERIANPNCIFRVGDTKQSIYRFRQAKPELMRAKLDASVKIGDTITNNTLLTSAKIILSRNYRSDANIIKFTNKLFTKIMNVDESKENYGQDDIVDWHPSHEDPDSLIEFAAYTPHKKTAYISSDDDETEDLKQIKAGWIANQIASIYNQELVKAKQTTPPSFHDFAILLRNHNDKTYIKAAFDEKGIPYSIDTREGFYRSKLVQAVIALCSAMLDEEDELALFACMVSDLYRYSDNEIAAAKIRYGSIKAAARQMGIYTDLQHYKETADTYGITHMLSELAKHNSFFDHLNITQQANFDYLFEMTVSARYRSVTEFLAALKAVEEEVSNEAVSKGSADDIVTVTTIHHSKGLQYKYVFLWSNAANPFRDGMESVNIDDTLYLGLNYQCTIPYRAKRKTIHKRAIEYKANLEDAEEFIRILYVAVTRAVHRLYIVDALPKEIPYRGSHFMLGDLLIRNGMSGLIMSTMKNEPIMHTSIIDPQWNVPLHYTASRTFEDLPHFGGKPQQQTAILTPSSTEYGKILPPLDLQETNAGREYGTYIHACFEKLPDRLFTKEDLHTLNLSPTEVRRMLAFGESLLFKRAVHGEIHHEFPFYVQTDQEKIHGIMDFISVLEKEIILIDFKTDTAPPEEIKKRYTEQINTYRKALQRIYPQKEIHAYAWSVHHCMAIEIN